MKKCISQNELKSVYVEDGTAKKIFAADYNKSDVLYEALNTARVEDAGVDIPKLLAVSVENGQWSITSEYIDGITLTELISKHPEKAAVYIRKMAEYQVEFQKKTNPLLLKLKDKLVRQINDLKELDSSIKYELLTRLNTMPKHTKLCHGDYCPDNIIVHTDDDANITDITAVDWVHATQGNASADIANTYLMLKLQYGDSFEGIDGSIADLYMSDFCEITGTNQTYVTGWLPIVAAARMTKNKAGEKELLEHWVNIVDFQ